jgi:hypothetical protein
VEALLLLQGVCEVSLLAEPSEPTRVTQRTFDAARAHSSEFPDLPAARQIAAELRWLWQEVLAVAHEPPEKHGLLLGRKNTEPEQDWLTEDYVASVLKRVARRLGTPGAEPAATVTPGAYRVEREAMLRRDRAHWLHGRKLLLPTDEQIKVAVGDWDTALRLAGLKTDVRPPRAIHQVILTRVEVMERFYDHYEEQPTQVGLNAFARGNKLPMSGEGGRLYSEAINEWRQQRRDSGLPEPRAVKRVGGRGADGRPAKAPDYSKDVGAARPGEYLHRGKWSNADACAEWVARYIASLGPGEWSTKNGYENWARQRPEAPDSFQFWRHGGWGPVRQLAQARTRMRERGEANTPQRKVRRCGTNSSACTRSLGSSGA